MSKNIDDILREIAKSNKEIHNMDNHLSRDIVEIKRTVKNIENKIKILEDKITQAVELLNTFTVLISDMDEDVDIDDELDEHGEWTPYDAIEDYYNDNDDEDEEEEEN